MLVVDLMTRNVITVTRDTPVLEALKIMHQNGFRRLPVVDEDGRPVGVVSRGVLSNSNRSPVYRRFGRLAPGLPGIWWAK